MSVKVIKFTDEEVSNIEKIFDDYDTVKNACDKLICSIVWEHNEKCQKNMREKIIEYVSEICKQRYDVDVINELKNSNN